MIVPFVDLNAQYNSIKTEIDEAVGRTIKSTRFIGGEPVAQFEKQFAEYLGVSHCVGCGNGTDALEIALQALEISRGDEVLVPAMTWISTSEAVSTIGAKPVFVDINPDTFTIDHTLIAEKITPKTRAIIPVHFYGMPCDMDPIISLAEKHNLYIIEDCAQAHGAEYKGRKVGNFGELATFSFYPGKNLGAYGDAGCTVTNNPELAEKIRLLGNHGQQGKHNHLREGRNSRLDTLQAAILSAKLHHLDNWNKARQTLAGAYNDALKGMRYKTQYVPDYTSPVFHVFAVLTDNRDNVKGHLSKFNIQSQVHYPRALPYLPAYGYFNHSPDDFPVAFEHGEKELSLPMYPEMSLEQLEFVCSKLKLLS